MAYPSMTAIKLLDVTAAVATPELAMNFAMRHGLIAGSQAWGGPPWPWRTAEVSCRNAVFFSFFRDPLETSLLLLYVTHLSEILYIVV